ncbi:MAG: sugar phosphate isomerase/epimerase [Bacteroides sp.]|uniref:sugar phosphate isomerase/epimerase family protein n=2 Tax=Bacteroides sp. TaxID=29523 RepID=UPI001B7CADCD|nr:sugar phosphate isomerase/epimerase family protein [Bacteroides sp.]MBP6065700.1 sugar phosphate isomerase/epimerase [Bacteroides sp.]MBP6067983.1 sugar phosphate isomerase/epimerase [Bacteroides sp.]MBP8622457.1 sugar phosphate isomerase/epimerase [Bacteroides sp.]MBP9506640.1 sugar phosphate isomerase/epimerase [Bacteroides sp.]MBP9586064.1 sugar phosphate isomerase/epimerase [Bacteroides sp.]
MKNNCFAYTLCALCFLELFAFSTYASSRQEDRSFKVAVCDWMILKRQKIGSFELARELNADGLEMDMGGLGTRDSFDNKLRQPYFQQLFQETAAMHCIEVPSVAMSGFYAQSFAERPDYEALVQDCLNTMKVMGAKVAFLPLGVQCDLNKHAELRPVLIERLRRVGELAVHQGVVIGIETSLDARAEVKLLKEINSRGIKIYYNFQNPLQNGRDLHKELRTLGKDRICQIHCTDTDEVTLPNNKRLDMQKVKKTLNSMGWSGWLVVERSRDKNDVRNVKKNFGINVEYLKLMFQ